MTDKPKGLHGSLQYRLRRIIADAEELLRALDMKCADPECGAAFIPKRHKQKYCTTFCANRAAGLRFRAKQRRSDPT